MHPSSRNSASGKYREEQSSRPARPRLSRDAVDRAWENGATRTYADYHPRQNSPTSPAQRQGRPAPAYERSRQPQNRRPYEPSQQTYGAPHHPSRPGGYQPRPQSEEGPRRFERPGYRAPGGQPGLSSERWTRHTTPQQPGNYAEHHENDRPPRFQQENRDNYRSTSRPPRFQQENRDNYRSTNRPPRFQQDDRDNYRNTNRPPRFQQENRDTYRSANRPPRFQQDGPETYRSSNRPRSFDRSEQGSRPPARGPHRDNYNPRWQSRPGPQRDYVQQQRDYPAPRNEYANERPGRAQFEGDYERFSDHERPDTHERPAPAYEPPVTRLPDGRVLKGSRPSQRRQATFWNGVEDQTSELLSNVSTPQEEAEQADPQEQEAPATRPARPKKPGASRVRSVKTVKTTRPEGAKPHTDKVARKNARGPQKPVTRPSRRGYKWPAAGE